MLTKFRVPPCQQWCRAPGPFYPGSAPRLSPVINLHKASDLEDTPGLSRNTLDILWQFIQNIEKNKFEIISKSWLNLIFEHFEHFEHLDICLKSFRITFGQEAREELERTRCHAEATERTQLFSAQFSYTDFSSWFLPSIGTAWPIWCLCVSYCLIDQLLQVSHMCCIIRRYKYKSSIAYDFLWSCRSW